MFNVSSLDGNTGSADYTKKIYINISKPLLDINYLTVYGSIIMYSSHKMDLRKNVDLNALYHASKVILKDGFHEG